MKIGSLFSGAGGLDTGVQAVFGGDVVWHCEPEMMSDKKGSAPRPNPALKVLERRFPDVPNLGDISKVDWSTVEPVDIICGGFPCQDMSAAGRRAGLQEGTRSGLWIHMALAIAALQPKWVVIENVRGLLSAKAHRSVDEGSDLDVESEDAVVGDNPTRALLRAAGAVLGDLADLRYDACWTTVSASAVGAPHRRERVFVIGYPADSSSRREDAAQLARQWSGVVESGVADAAVELGEGESQGDDSSAVDASSAGAGDRDRAGDSASGVRVVGRGAGPLSASDGGDVVADADHGGREGGAEQDGQPVGSGVEASRRGDVDRRGGDVAESEGVGRPQRKSESARVVGGSDAAISDPETRRVEGLLPTPRASRGASTTETSYALGGQRSDANRPQGEVLLPTPTTINASSQKAKTGRTTSGPQRGGPSYGLEDVVKAELADEDVTLLPSPCAGDGDAGRPWGRNGTQINLPGVARQLAGDENVLPGTESRYHGAKPDATHYLPTPCAQQSGNTPENHLAKKPGRKQVTDLAILVENGLLETGGELFPTPTTQDGANCAGPSQFERNTPPLNVVATLLPTPQAQDGGGPHGDRGGYRPSRAGRQASLSDALTDPALLPTPVSSDYKGADPEKVSWENTTKSRGEGGASSLGDIAPLLAPPLLPTPAASDGDGGKTSRSGDRKDEPLLGNIAALLPTPVTTDANSAGRHSTQTGVMHAGTSLTDALRELLPTPNAADGARGKGPRSEEKLAQTRQGDERLDRQKGLPDLPRLLPTPAAADSDRRQDYARADRDGSGGDDLVTAAVKASNTQQWGKYAPAIERWEAVTRPAPPPTEPNTKGNPRLSPAFSEWLMGWPLGWVTEKGLISRNDQLRIIGNGVVPQQCAVALITLLNIIARDAG